MIPVRVKQGYQLKMEGAPTRDLVVLDTPAKVALLPEKIGFIRPRLAVSAGDRVKVGSVLFSDKRNSDIVFLSPGTGTIEDIRLGPRRVIQSIVIELAANEDREHFNALDERGLAGMDRATMVSKLLSMGFWPRIRTLPFRDIASPAALPPKIVVTLNDLESFSPSPAVYLSGREDLFVFGLKALGRLTEKILVAVGTENAAMGKTILEMCPEIEICTVDGVYPALDPGVVVYHTKAGREENRSWFVDGQDVLMLGELLTTGEYPTERIMVVAGPMAREKRHVKTRLGVPLADLVGSAGLLEGPCRYVVGGVFTGFRSGPEGFMGFYESALALLPEGADREFMALFRPGYNKPSFSRTFLSVFNRKPLASNCSTHGEERACIACNYCPSVCPVDILPQLAYKCVLADDIDGALSHGLLDCVACGLCSYVCPSKIELSEVLSAARDKYYREQSQ